MKALAVPFAVLATALITSCSGGGSSPTPTSVGSASIPSATGSPGSSTPSNAQKSSATFSITIPAAGAGTIASSRATQFVAPSTTTIYISLEDTPGHGNATFSYTEAVNAKNCTLALGAETCTFNVQVPIGTDYFSILTTDANNIPLGYATPNGTITAGGSNTLGSEGQLSPIIAKAIPQYAFQTISTMIPPAPAVTTTVYDAAGNLLSLFPTANNPFGNAYSSVTATQTVGQFTAVINAHGRIVATSSPENTVTYGVQGGALFIVEAGNGTTNAFSTTLALSTPAVQFTRTEFPQLPSAALTVPPSSSSLTLTCTFPTAQPTTDPCPGTASATIHLF